MTIIQFSPIRSGSTLVYNYLLELDYIPKKMHNYCYDKKNQYIITIRHPYNSIISSILRHEQDINVTTIQTGILEYLRNGGDDLVKYNFTEDDNHCILFYEEFLNNHDLILNKIEFFFNKTYASELKYKIKNKLEINNVKSTIIKNGYKNFSNYDERSHFHGKHISKFNGTIDYNKILNKDELNVLEKNKKLSKIIQKYYN